MGVPLPQGTLNQVNRRFWPGEEDTSSLTDSERMERADDAYHGRFKKTHSRTSSTAPDHNVTNNRCAPIVATNVDAMLGDEVSFEVTSDDGKADKEATQYLEDVWEANVKMPTLAEYEINSAIFGHAFLRLNPTDEDTAPYPSLSILNSRQMRVEPKPADVRKAQRYIFTYEDVDESGDPRQCRQVTERQSDGRWLILDQARAGGVGYNLSGALQALPGQDTEAGWEDIAPPTIWNYQWSPIHDVKNLPEPNSYWGKADLTMDIIHLNDVLNFLLSDAKAIIYAQGKPKDIFFGIRAKDLETKADGAICIATTNARVEHIEMTGDLAAIRLYIEDIRESMDELSHVPSVAVGRLKNLPGVPSGVALKVAYQPLVSQVMQKRNLRKTLYTRLCQHILELGGYGAARKITIGWAEPVPSDEFEDSKTAVSDKALGFSDFTLIKRRNGDPDFEREKRQEEAKEAIEAAQEQMAATGMGNPQMGQNPGQNDQNQPPDEQNSPQNSKKGGVDGNGGASRNQRAAD